MTPVVPGFLGAGPDGTVTTLGRGGSDLTATLLARSLGASRVVLWKDVAGILTADPRAVPDARLLPQMHHREAAEVAYFGAKVLHPRALIPLDGSSIALHVRSFLHPERPGTEVSARRTLAAYPVKALATIRGQALVTVAGKGLMGVPGMAARTFAAIHAEGLSVSTIFQSSSESSIGFTLPGAEAERAVAGSRARVPRRDPRRPRGRRQLAPRRRGDRRGGPRDGGDAGGRGARLLRPRPPGASTSSRSRRAPRSSTSRSWSRRRRRRRRRGASTPPSSSRRSAAGEPVDRRRTDVVLLGFGRVGRALAAMAAGAGDGRIRIVAALDRSGYVFDPRGVSRARLQRLAEGKDKGALLAGLGGRKASAPEALGWIAAHAVSRPVLVDVTAEETGDLLATALGQGFDLVLANKKPLAGSSAAYRRLLETAAAAGRRVRYEATVGAGLPVIDTFRKLVESGDRVMRVEGCVSGTLGFVLSSLEAGRPFSEAVREAVAKGYAEPDPREDLSGRDVLRKGLILARLLGHSGPAPAAENLVPPALRRLPLARFLAAARLARRGLAPASRRRGGPRARAALRGRGHGARRLRRDCGPSRATRASAPSPARAICCRSRPAATARSRSSSPAPAPAPRSPPPAS